MCIRLLCTYYSVYRYVCAYYFLYSPPPSVCRRLDASDRCYEISRPKSWRPSFFFLPLLYLSLLFCRTTRLPPRPARSWGAQQRKRYAIRFRASAFAPFDSLADRHRPAGQGRVRPEFARRDANTQIIRVYYYYYY